MPVSAEKIALIQGAHTKLEEMHDTVIERIKKLETVSADGLSILVSNGEIKGECLGHKIESRHTMVIRDGVPSDLEYTFSTPAEDQKVVFLRLYLSGARDDFYLDQDLDNIVCSAGNPYLVERWAPHFITALLGSSLYVQGKPQPRR